MTKKRRTKMTHAERVVYLERVSENQTRWRKRMADRLQDGFKRVNYRHHLRMKMVKPIMCGCIAAQPQPAMAEYAEYAETAPKKKVWDKVKSVFHKHEIT